MPARDLFHHAARTALEKAGWLITDDPFFIQFAQVDMYIDLGAEKLIAAEKDNLQIAVEVKSFLGSSAISDFHTALGQFMNYRLALAELQPKRELYLAVPSDTYFEFFMTRFGQIAIEHYGLKLIVYGVVAQEIVEWRE